VKKLISIGVALALLAMVIVPVTVAAQDYTPTAYNSTYSKIPFGILSTGLALIGDVVAALPASITGGTDLSWIGSVIDPVAGWVGGPFAWLTELTAWTMITVGDVVSQADAIIGAVATLPFPLKDVATIFYTVGNRMFDNNNIPTAEMDAQLPPALGLLP
jgi:hypothetical protein